MYCLAYRVVISSVQHLISIANRIAPFVITCQNYFNESIKS